MAAYSVDPKSRDVSRSCLERLSPVATRRLKSSWHFLFRCVILDLMPAESLAMHFHPVNGRPTKELYSIAGLVLIKEFMNWTNERAADSYMFDLSIQYALNLEPDHQSMCERTLDRYCKLFREDDIAKQIMNDVTRKLVEVLELDFSKQRLDSTHVSSNMAVFGRTRLMGVVIKGFMEHLRKHSPRLYGKLPETIQNRYAPSRNQLFGGWKKDDDWTGHRQTVAEEMHWLIVQFAMHKTLAKSKPYQMLKRVFDQQCEVQDEKVQVRVSPGGNIITNPSDPDATLDGHKGSGFQIQLSETCSHENKIQLIVSAIPEQAHQCDSDALKKVLTDLNENDLLPNQMVADTAYGSDENYVHSNRYGVELIAPVPGQESESKANGDQFRETDFQVEEREVTDMYGVKHINPFIVTCPAGKEPHRSHYDHIAEKMEILHYPETCRSCLLRSRCPVRYANGWMLVTIHAKPLRMSKRRNHQRTDDFKAKYRKRSGIESTNSLLKRVMGLGRLRVRGKPSVFMAMVLKVAGWNILQASRSRKLMQVLIGLFSSLMRFCKPNTMHEKTSQVAKQSFILAAAI